MKKIFSIYLGIALLVLCVGFTSCSKDDNNVSGGGKKLLVGKWKYYAKADLSYDDGWFPIPIPISDSIYIQFNSNGSCYINGYVNTNTNYPTKPTTWEIDGGQLNVEKNAWSKINFKRDPNNADFSWWISFWDKSKFSNDYFANYYYQYIDINGDYHSESPYDYDIEFKFDYPDILVEMVNSCYYRMYIRVK